MGSETRTVAVLMGGQASEHDISMKTGTVVLNALDREKWRVLPIIIDTSGRWIPPDAPVTSDAKWTAAAPVGAAPGTPLIPVDEILQLGIDVAFVALHGRYGEDGCVQGFLEMLGIPYTGSGVLASSLAMDKVRSKKLLACCGVPTAEWLVIEQTAWSDDRDGQLARIEAEFDWPCVVKIPEEGSSFGMGIPSSREELSAVVDVCIGVRGHMMVEKYLRGREITCAVLGGFPGEQPTALPLTEIIPKASSYFDFEAKYTPGASEEITPARLDADLTAEAQRIAITAHRELGCGGMSRTDMIVVDRDIYYLETNTIPGMTETSLYPQAAAAAGMPFRDLLEHQVELALAYHRPSRCGKGG